MNITANKRGPQTKGERKQRIRQGFIPGSIYGKGLEPLDVEVPSKAIAEILSAETGLNTIIDLAISGDTQDAFGAGRPLGAEPDHPQFCRHRLPSSEKKATKLPPKSQSF